MDVSRWSVYVLKDSRGEYVKIKNKGNKDLGEGQDAWRARKYRCQGTTAHRKSESGWRMCENV